MQLPILQGIYTDANGDYRRLYPVNLMAVAQNTGLSNGYLRPADGIEQFAAISGLDRGGIVWNGTHYRVIGSNLCTVSTIGAVTVIGAVGGSGQVTFDYSFDRLVIASSGLMYYYNGETLTQVIDPDLGTVVDCLWVDGYFMTTDGTSLVVTELNDPTSIDPIKYGSSEIDPDPVVALWKIRSEVYAVNRHSIEVFDNVGASGFPFQRIEGAVITRGAVGTHMCCTFADSLAFVGGGRNEAIGVYLGLNATSRKISTREIDLILAQYPESVLSQCLIESRVYEGTQQLYLHLPDRTLVFDLTASETLQDSVWSVLTSTLSVDSFAQYQCRNLVLHNGAWIGGDPTSNRLGKLVRNVATHYGQHVRWEFGTMVIYNQTAGAVFNEVELIALPGRCAFGDEPEIATCYSVDGVTWSEYRYIRSGLWGSRNGRLTWFRQGLMRNVRMQRFIGDSQSFLSVARLDCKIEPLGV